MDDGGVAGKRDGGGEGEVKLMTSGCSLGVFHALFGITGIHTDCLKAPFSLHQSFG